MVKDFFDIEKLRALPAPVRAQVAFGAAATVAGVIGIIWVTTLGTRFADTPQIAEIIKEEPKPAVVTQEAGAGRSWSEFTGSVRSQLGAVIEAFKSVRIELEDESVYIESQVEAEVTPEATPEMAPATSTESTPSTPVYEPEPAPPHVILDGTSTVKNSQ